MNEKNKARQSRTWQNKEEETKKNYNDGKKRKEKGKKVRFNIIQVIKQMNANQKIIR